jgi:hypothetical protein
MIGDALREAGTLVIVSAPLYVIFEQTGATWNTLVSVLLVGIAFLYLGILLERSRL